MKHKATFRLIVSRQTYSGRCMNCKWHAEAPRLAEIIDMAEDHDCELTRNQHKRRVKKRKKVIKRREQILADFYNHRGEFPEMDVDTF